MISYNSATTRAVLTDNDLMTATAAENHWMNAPTDATWTTGTYTSADLHTHNMRGVHSNNVHIMGEIDVDLQYRALEGHGDFEDDHRIRGRIRLNEPNIMEPRTLHPSRGLNTQYGFEIRKPISRDLMGHQIEQMLPYLKEQFMYELQRAAKDAGHKIARELIDNNLPLNPIQAKKKLLNELLYDCEIEIPTKDGELKVPLYKLLKKDLKEGNKLTFDFDVVRLEKKRHKKKIYVNKIRSVNIRNKIVTANILGLEDAYKFWNVRNQDFSSHSELEIDKELKALTLLRRLVEGDDFTKYIQDKYIDIPDIRAKKVYRVYRDRRVEVIDTQKQMIEGRICLHLNNDGGPKTDDLIMKMMFARNNPQELFKRGNHYECKEPLLESNEKPSDHEWVPFGGSLVFGDNTFQMTREMLNRQSSRMEGASCN